MPKIIKVGGSLITFKNRPYTPNHAVMKRIASVLADAKNPFILVHGTGSFGKEPAVRYGYADGLLKSADIPCAAIKHDVFRLHAMFMRHLVDAGIKAVSFGADALCLMEKGVIKRIDTDAPERWLKRNFVPVVRSDIACDSSSRLSVCSSDDLSLALAEKMGWREVVFLTDVDGIYDGNSRLFSVVNRAALRRLSRAVQRTPGDVSGGMAGKIDAVMRRGKSGLRVRIMNGLKIESASEIFGRRGGGTLICA